MLQWIQPYAGRRPLLSLLGVGVFALALGVAVLAHRMPRDDNPEAVAITIDSLRAPGLSVLEHVKQSGRLVVLTHAAPTVVEDVPGTDTLSGFEADLVTAFAEHLGVTPEFQVLPSADSVRLAMARGNGHLAAAGLIADPRAAEEDDREAPVFGPVYRTTRQQLVCHRGRKPANAVVIAETGYAPRLDALRPDDSVMTWATTDQHRTPDLLERVADGKIDCTVGNDTLIAIQRRYHPELAFPTDLTEPEPIAWQVIARAPAFKAEIDAWFRRPATKRLLVQLEDKHFGHAVDYHYRDIATFRRRMAARLPRYRTAFEDAAAETGLPWTLLAAVAYQESHWAPDARSPTGVRGMMMLTRATASEVGVSDRTDAFQSIDGGARYLAAILERLPDGVVGEDRLWMALASYNVGLGHLYDARRLAVREGLDPDRWIDVKAMLPRLADPAYYPNLRYGYARGNEPVRYVRRVRHYHDMLERAVSGDV